MSKVFIEETTLSAIGDSIREKTGKTGLIAPGDMPAEIDAITTGGGEVEPIVLTGDCSYRCAGSIASAYIELYGNTISTDGITNANSMFKDFSLTKIPFEINFKSSHSLEYFAQNATKLTELPKVNNAKPSSLNSCFYGAESIRQIPDDYFDNWDFSYIANLTNAYNGSASNMFARCISLRRFPVGFLKNMNPYISQTYAYISSFCSYCYSLDELLNLSVPCTKGSWTSNALAYTVNNCYRLKNFTFEIPDGQPAVVQWKNQTFDLSKFVGYVQNVGYILDSNSGITADKEVTDDTTYQALKDDPDWWTTDIAYSRYNHDSAVATINSLPDTSAYLATAGGTNAIIFKGSSGSATDGGAINTLTEEEIAVAAAKGWTVTLV